MTDEAREARKAYKREWQRKNPEKVRAQQERYWTRRAQRESEQLPGQLQIDIDPAREAGKQ